MRKMYHMGLLISLLGLVVGASVFAAQQAATIGTSATAVVEYQGKYIYIKNNNTGNKMFVPYTDQSGVSYGCPTGNSNRTTWKFSNVYSDTTKIVSGNKSVGPSRGAEISCGCPNPDYYAKQAGTQSVPHNRSGDLYDTEQVVAGDTCASHKLHVLCDNGNISDTLGTHIYPTCLEAPQATCALKRFLQGVSGGTVTYSKVRNAMASASTTETSQVPPYASGYSLGYGELLSGVNYGYTRTSTSLPGQYIIRSPIYGVTWDGDNNGNYTVYLSQLELYGVTLATEGTNRGCIGNTGYWVTSNVKSYQTIVNPYGGAFQYTGAGASAWKTRSDKVDFEYQSCDTYQSIVAFTPKISIGPKVYASNLPGPSDCVLNYQRKVNTAYGCQAELLPNPDLYCVEKVVNNGQAKAMFTTLYLKEFTKAYPGSTSCSAITALSGISFKLLTKEDFGALGTGYHLPGDTSTLWRYDRNLINVVTYFSTRGGYSYLPSIPVGGAWDPAGSNGSNFIHGNTHPYVATSNGRGGQQSTGYRYAPAPLFTPSTAIFGKFIFDDPGNNADGRYQFGGNTPSTDFITIKIPLANNYGFYMQQGGDIPQYTYIATGQMSDAELGGTNTIITKNVCYSYQPTCLPGYKFQTGVVGKYGDGCQPITPIPCVDDNACGVGAKCIGHQTGTTSCVGTTNVCNTSRTVGLIGGTSVKTAGCYSSSSPLVATYSLLFNGTYYGNQINLDSFVNTIGSSSYSDTVLCDGNLDSLCRYLTRYGGSNTSSIYTEVSSNAYRVTTNTCGSNHAQIANGQGTKAMKSISCFYNPGDTCTTISTANGTSACTAATGCSVNVIQPEVMGQCTR